MCLPRAISSSLLFFLKTSINSRLLLLCKERKIMLSSFKAREMHDFDDLEHVR